MGFRDDKEMVIGNDKNANKSIEPTPDELSDIWQKLLGTHPAGKETTLTKYYYPPRWPMIPGANSFKRKAPE